MMRLAGEAVGVGIRVGTLLCLALGLGLGGAAAAAPTGPSVAPDEILVRFRAEGPHALRACAQALSAQGRPFGAASADGSDSLDRLHAALGVREMRAVFRRSDGLPFDEQRDRLRARWESIRAARVGRTGPPGLALPDLSHVYRVRLPAGSDVWRAAALYRADSHVAWAQPNFLATVDYEPDDPLFSSSASWGQPYRDLWGVVRIDASDAWEISEGEGVVVAVVDSGLDYGHPDIAANVWVNPGEDLDGNGRVDPSDFNGIDDDDNGFIDDLRGFDFANSEDVDGDGRFDGPDDVNDPDPFDDKGHGTHVAGTIAAVGNNGIGIIGVAPRARIMPLKGFRQEGPSTFEVLTRAMVYAIENGARVINNSWSCGGRCPSNPIVEEVVELASALGVVVVTSAGNRGDDVVFYSPENTRHAIAVGAITEIDAPPYFTNFGMLMDVAAPGSGESNPAVRLAERAVLSLRSSGTTPDSDASGDAVVAEDYMRWRGTSMSSPHVAGIAALLLAQRPELTTDEVRAILRVSADDVGLPGHDRMSGAGIASAARALETQTPRATAEIASPRPGGVFSQRQGELVLEGTAAGPAFDRYQLWVGKGADPASWQPLAPVSSTPVEAGVLAAWPIHELPDGGYVVRLDVTTQGGLVLTEMLQLSLERNVPERVSSFGESAGAPDLSGDRVVWQSARPTADDPDAEIEEGLNLFVTDLRRDAESLLADGPADQRAAAIRGSRVAWLDAGRGDSHEIFQCVLEPGQQPCRAEPLATGPDLRTPPVMSDRWIAWAEVGERTKIRACRFARRTGRCDEVVIPQTGNRQFDPVLDGDLLIWSEAGSTLPRVMFCDLSGRACEPTRVGVLASVQGMVASEGRLVWNQFGGLILSCLLDLDTGECPIQVIEPVRVLDFATQLDLSGNRLVWDALEIDGGRNIHFCEFGRVTGGCVPQRLTGSITREQHARIDGRRVVWEDERNGPWAVMSFVLPALRPLRDRVVRQDERVVVRVASSDPREEPLFLEARQADGSPLEAIGATFRDRGDGTGTFSWRPGPGRAGRHAVTFIGTTPGGLVTQQTILIDVRATPPDLP